VRDARGELAELLSLLDEIDVEHAVHIGRQTRGHRASPPLANDLPLDPREKLEVALDGLEHQVGQLLLRPGTDVAAQVVRGHRAGRIERNETLLVHGSHSVVRHLKEKILFGEGVRNGNLAFSNLPLSIVPAVVRWHNPPGGRMTLERKYADPPIEEALCEAYFSGGRWDPTMPGLFFQRIQEEFPNQALALPHPLGHGRLPEDPDAGLTSGTWRMQFHRKGGGRIVQLAKDLVVVNQLRPYPGFDEWRPDAVQMISLYRELASPAKIERLGLRYMNRVVLPGPSIRMSEYFSVHAVVPPQLGGECSSFLVRVEVPPIFPGHRLLITLSSAPPRVPGTVEVLLDLYDIVTATDEFPLDSFEAMLRAAHENVLCAFESTLQPAARQLFHEKAEAANELRP